MHLMSRPPPRRLSPQEVERAFDEIVDEFAARLGIPSEQGRALLYSIMSVLVKHGVTLEAAIEALADPPPVKPN
jgi:hypothetical protein